MIAEVNSVSSFKFVIMYRVPLWDLFEYQAEFGEIAKISEATVSFLYCK